MEAGAQCTCAHVLLYCTESLLQKTVANCKLPGREVIRQTAQQDTPRPAHDTTRQTRDSGTWPDTRYSTHLLTRPPGLYMQVSAIPPSRAHEIVSKPAVWSLLAATLIRNANHFLYMTTPPLPSPSPLRLSVSTSIKEQQRFLFSSPGPLLVPCWYCCRRLHDRWGEIAHKDSQQRALANRLTGSEGT